MKGGNEAYGVPSGLVNSDHCEAAAAGACEDDPGDNVTENVQCSMKKVRHGKCTVQHEGSNW